ncbi:thiamine-phosphate kinase [Arhodomonas sp. AD133]|uniref:thiamine-phosphate kinase n=1 Tax=Arhodomonas sp. AD133 TaxID=3415009 RepID=UPI003EB7A51F
MPLSEFGLIERYFSGLGAIREDVSLGIGDDAALVQAGGGTLALAVDTLIEDVHFPADAPPRSIGHKLLAVNLSDLAAMGAAPAWALLALTLRNVDESWLADLRDGLDGLARAHGVALVGGDTTRGGRITASVFVAGQVERPMRRDGARVGDDLWVSGIPGEAAAGLTLWQNGQRSGEAVEALVARLHWPEPRVALGRSLRGVASAAVDISDGLLADAGHLSARSAVAIRVCVECLPVSPALASVGGTAARDYALSGGDDYELLFTAPASAADQVRAAADAAATPVTRIGEVVEGPAGVAVHDTHGRRLAIPRTGYQHFSGDGE